MSSRASQRHKLVLLITQAALASCMITAFFQTPTIANTYTNSSVLPASGNLAARQALSQIPDGQVQAPTTTSKKRSTITTTRTTTVSILSCSGSSSGSCGQPSTTSSASTSMVKSNSKSSTSTSKSKSSTKFTTSAGCVRTTASSKSVITMPAVSQIPDGQIQQPKPSSPAPQPSKPVTTIPAVSQIPDGQVQQPKPSTPAPRPSMPVSTMPAVSQIPDGQIQQPKPSSSTPCPPSKSSAQPSMPVVSIIKDGQLQAPSSRPSQMPQASYSSLSACSNNSTLSLTLNGGILKDARGWTGYIAANRQFQFDQPPQAGALLTRGFSICSNGSLALQGRTMFWECLSGDFYNLYDQRIGGQCRPITLNAAQLIKC